MIKKANVLVQVFGVKDSLMHLEARKANRPETLFVTWAKVSDDNKFLYSWQLMHRGTIKAGDGSTRPVSHEELTRDVQTLIENVFIDEPTRYADPENYSLLN